MFARKVFVEKAAIRMLTMKGSKLAYVVLVDEASEKVLTLIISELIRVRNRSTRRWRIHRRRLRVVDGMGGERAGDDS